MYMFIFRFIQVAWKPQYRRAHSPMDAKLQLQETACSPAALQPGSFLSALSGKAARI